jgi:sugar phosphate isomerase/epimerase
LRTIDFAASLGAPIVVLHLGRVEMRDYTEKLMELFAHGRAAEPKFERVRIKAITVRAKKRQKYFDQVRRTLDEILPRAKELKITLGIETRFGIEEIPSEDEVGELLNIYGTESLAYWHDIGHAQVKENFGFASHESLLKRYQGRTAGMHLQDFAPPAFDHQPPGFGTFDFTRLTPWITPSMSLIWEIHKGWTAEQVQAACQKFQDVLRPPAPA